MVETKLLVNVGLKLVFGSLMSLPVTVMLHVSPPGNDMVSWSDQRVILCPGFRTLHEQGIFTCESLCAFRHPTDISSQPHVDRPLQCNYAFYSSYFVDLI